MAKKDNTLVFEILDKKDCGFIMDGTEGKSYEQRLVGSDFFNIPNTGKAAVVKADGQIEYVDVRYIAGDTSIFVEDQDKRKVHYNAKDTGNKPQFKKNLMILPDEPGLRTLRDYLLNVFYCEDAPHRPETATALYRVVKLEEKTERLFSENEAMYSEAVFKASTLRKKKGKDGFTYDEEKIDGYMRIFGLSGGDDYAEKFMVVLNYAKRNYANFLESIAVVDNTISMEIEQAYKLKVISFDDNVAAIGDRIVKPLGTEKLTVKRQIEIVADFMKTTEGNQFLEEMRAKVADTQKKSLVNK